MPRGRNAARNVSFVAGVTMSDLTPDQLKQIKSLIAPLTRAMIVAGAVVAPSCEDVLSITKQVREVIFSRRRGER